MQCYFLKTGKNVGRQEKEMYMLFISSVSHRESIKLCLERER